MLQKLKFIYTNPEAKKALTIFLVISSILLIFMIGWITFTYGKYNDAINMFFTNLLESTKKEPLTYNNLLDFFNKTDFTTTSQTFFTPKLISDNFLASVLLTIALWFLISSILFILMSYFLYQFYMKIDQLDTFVSQISLDKQPINLTMYNEGIYSKLENNLYQQISFLHTQATLNKKHKEYLAKNIADISHQLKTPLSSLMILTDTLLLDKIDDQTKEKIQAFNPQLNKIENLIQSLLLLTRLDAGVIQLKYETISLQQILSALQSEFNILLQHKSISFSLNTTESIVIGDTFLITETFSNIIKNAIDHTFEKGTISIMINDDIFFSTVKIFNTGKPISKEDLPHLFERFYRGKNATSSSIGIGLALAYEIVQLHHGKITAENVENGVLFTISIPKK